MLLTRVDVEQSYVYPLQLEVRFLGQKMHANWALVSVSGPNLLTGFGLVFTLRKPNSLLSRHFVYGVHKLVTDQWSSDHLFVLSAQKCQ